MGEQGAADALPASLRGDRDAQRRHVARDGVELTLDVDVSHDPVAGSGHDLGLVIRPCMPEARAIDAQGVGDPLAADVAAFLDDLGPELQERSGIASPGRPDRDTVDRRFDARFA